MTDNTRPLTSEDPLMEDRELLEALSEIAVVLHNKGLPKGSWHTLSLDLKVGDNEVFLDNMTLVEGRQA